MIKNNTVFKQVMPNAYKVKTVNTVHNFVLIIYITSKYMVSTYLDASKVCHKKITFNILVVHESIVGAQ